MILAMVSELFFKFVFNFVIIDYLLVIPYRNSFAKNFGGLQSKKMYVSINRLDF